MNTRGAGVVEEQGGILKLLGVSFVISSSLVFRFW